MFGETRLAIFYFQQMTLYSKIPKIIHTPPQSVNYFVYFEAECIL